jgi:nickel-dependent lactate racemase
VSGERGRAGEVGFGDRTLPVPEAPFRLEVPAPPVARARRIDVARALDRPLHAPPLTQVFRGAKQVLIAVSDATRSTAAAEFLPPLLERIESAAPGSAVRFIVGSGIHRRPTDSEIARILGAEVARRHEVVLHDPDDEASLVELGSTSAGTRVRVHRSVRAHDRLVLTGGVGFHYYAGFSGGRKAVVPGLAARETIARNHLRALREDGSRHPLARAGVLRGNPVHRDMAEGAELAGPHLVVNSVLDDDGRIERLYVGHWRRAHEAACRAVRGARCLRLSPRPIVVASAGGEPGDINLIQSHKTFESAMGALAAGGTLILVARCREGAGHADFLPWLAHADEGSLVRALQQRFQVYGQTALSWLRKATRCRLILVSDLPLDVVKLLRAEPARDLGEALDLARASTPAGSRGWLLPHGSRFLIEPDDRAGRSDRRARVA